MELESLVDGVEKTLLESENVTKHDTEFFKKDAEVLAGLEKLKTPELTKEITKHLVKEGKPGSAEYIDMFSKSTVLDKELDLLESGVLDPQKIEQEGLPLMLDPQLTTPEMIRSGRAVLTPEARADLLGAANTLKYKLDKHITKTAQEASAHYATEITTKEGIAQRLRGLLGIKAEPYEIPFTPDETEIAKLEELRGLKYLTREEVQQTFQKALNHMMLQRPGLIGFTSTASASKFLDVMAQGLGGNLEGSGDVDIKNLRNLHEFMRGYGMEELQIYPEFGKAIENRVERDFAT